MAEKTVLLGLHEPYLLELLSIKLVNRDFPFTAAKNLDEMLQAMGIKPGDTILDKNPFTKYLMDLNLGHSRGLDYTPSLRVYNLVRPYVENGEARFLGISLNCLTVELAQEAGIPSGLGTNNIIDEFLGLRFKDWV